MAFAPLASADPPSTTPTAPEIVSHWREAMHADAGRGGVAHWRQRVQEDGVTRTDDTWIDRSGRYRATAASDFSTDDLLVTSGGAQYRDWDGFVRDLDSTELQRARRDAFSASVLAFGPITSGFAGATVAESADHTAWTLTMTPRGGAQIVWIIDKQSWLPQTSTSVDGDGNTIVTTYAGWSASGGVLAPRQITSSGSDNGGGTATLLSATFENAGQTFSRLRPGPSDVTLASDVVHIPFTNEASHVVVQVSVNGHAPIGFVFDTGDDTETLSAPRLAEMGVTAYGASQLVGGGNAAASSFARDLNLSMPGVELSRQHATVLDLSGLERAFGVPIGGILGYDFISRFVVELDYQSNIMTLRPRTWRYQGRAASAPITFDGGIPRTDVILSVPTKPNLPAHMIVDFGAADTMTLTSPFVAANDLQRLAGTNPTVFGASGLEHQFFTQHNTRGHIDALHLGGLTLNSIPVSFSANTSGAYASSSFAGTIGNGIYSRFHVYIDYARCRIVLEPTAHSNDPFPERRSFGLTLVADGADLHTYTIAAVRSGSPAEAAGFHQGDVVAGVDDRTAAQFKLSDLRELVLRTGERHVFHLRRADQMTDISANVTTVSIER